jgi:CheY-like chemotaxis protein
MTSTKLRVLVVDDEEDILETIQDRLEAYEFSVETAGTGLEALKRLSTERFDGVFLDIKMPGMSGIEVLEKIRKGGLEIPVIILTSSIGQDLAAEALTKGANAVILKPFEWEELKEKIEKVYNISL